MVANDDLNVVVDRARPHDFDRLRMAVFGDEERITAVPLRYSMEHHHRLGGGRRLIEQRCVRDRETRQIDEHRLENEQLLEPALQYLSLVRPVLRVTSRLLADVAVAGR